MKVLTIFLMMVCILDVIDALIFLNKSNVKITNLCNDVKKTVRFVIQIMLNILAFITFLYWLI